MNPILRNILALLLGIVVGSIVNMGIISVSGSIIPPPEGADVTTMEGLKEALPMFEPKHFIMPFLAHALGALAGAFLAAKLAANNKKKFAYGVAGFFLLGGIANAFMLPGPTWFAVTDILLAYIPMGWLGGKLAVKNTD